ncbi:MAG: hypothetical protein E6G35_15230 [Actinobacteria bacterium]|nr:MAG: hypothetical protein E6G35_15230 [Actinomycetota bacterium]
MIGDDRMDVGYELLDLQILDRDGMEVGKVDDVEFHLDEDGVPYLTALLVGPDVFGHRIGGWLGRVIAATTRRLRTNRSGPVRIPYDLIGSVRSAVTLTVSRDLLPEPELEHWLREHLIARIPGSGHAQ